MRYKLSLSILAVAVAGAASAAPTLWSSNGHYYELITGISPTWTQANAAASATTYFDGTRLYQGHLATITSQAENDFIVSLGAVDGLYIGGTYNGPPIGQYQWVTGEAFTYTNWQSGEPNGDSGVLQFAVGGAGTWNDLPDGAYAGTTFVRGYVVELTAVPGPAAALPFALGLLRRRKKARD